MATLFIVGSALFALGALPPYSEAAGLRATSLTFFVGSLFFTGAGFLQYREAVDGLSAGSSGGRKFWVWAPKDMDWLATAVQLAGTLWFNWSTGNALRHNLSAEVADQRVWRPDTLGSAAFLVASGIAWRVAMRDRSTDGRRTRDWWIAALNLLGSVAFGVSAAAAYVIHSADDVWRAELSNLGTLVGALCFLAGAILLLPRPAHVEG
ncbi:hypothetical protein SAMN05892883_2157 [Jatrophihabitans sp. GAS493]|nr:hypothetical protein SAMN05892883_2157 [Jatrophihabitans sp. GAS493]